MQSIELGVSDKWYVRTLQFGLRVITDWRIDGSLALRFAEEMIETEALTYNRLFATAVSLSMMAGQEIIRMVATLGSWQRQS